MAKLPKMRAGLSCGVLFGFLALTAPTLADSGPIKDPTGCAGGSAVANCRSLPPMHGDRDSGGQRLRPSQGHGLSTGDRLRQQSPLPSEGLRRTPSLMPPPGSTGLRGGSTGIGH